MRNYLKKLKRQLYNYGFTILFLLGGILDLGFNEIQPALEQLGCGSKMIGAIRISILILGALKLKLSLPTHNIEKLEKIVDEKDLCNDNLKIE